MCVVKTTAMFVVSRRRGQRKIKVTHLGLANVKAVGLVDVGSLLRGDSYLARRLIEDHRYQIFLVFIVCGLDDVSRAAEDYESIAGNVGLRDGVLAGAQLRAEAGQRHTMSCLPSQSPVVTAASSALGRPGRMARMEREWVSLGFTAASSWSEERGAQRAELRTGRRMVLTR